MRHVADPVLRPVTAPDILDLDLAQRDHVVTGFRGWLEQLQTPLRILVCGRVEEQGLSGPEGTLAGPQGRLQLEQRGHLADMLRRTGYRRRRVYFDFGDRGALALGGADGRLAAGLSLDVHPPAQPEPLAEGPRDEQPGRLRAGGRWLISMRLARLPGAPVSAGWLWNLIGTQADFDLLLDLRPRSAGSADRSLRRRLRGLRARQLVAADRGEVDDPRLATAVASAAALRGILAGPSGSLFELRLTWTVAADSRVAAERLGAAAQERLAALQGRLVSAWCDQVPARRETMLQARAGGPARLVSTEELATLWPWLDDWQGPVTGGINLGRHLRTDAPTQLDLFASQPNANLGVVAASGSGKSYLGGLLGLEGLRLGVRSVVLDPENEHRGWCQAVGGVYLRAGEHLPTGFNLLEMVEPTAAPSAAAELVSLLCGPLSPREAGMVAAAVRATLAEAEGSPIVLSDCLPHLRHDETGDEIALRLLPWLEGLPGAIFNRLGRGPDVDTVTAIGLRELPASWVPATTFLISHWLWAWIRFTPGRKQAIVDEAGLLADNPALQRLMAHLARRIRKYQGSLVLLTQAAGDLVGSGASEVLAVNSATLLLGNQRSAAAGRLQAAFQLDDGQRRFLEQAGRGQFLLVAGHRGTPVQVEAPGLYHRFLAGSLGSATEANEPVGAQIGRS